MLGTVMLGTIMLGKIMLGKMKLRVAKPYLLSTGALVALAAPVSVPVTAQAPARVSASQAETAPGGSISAARVQRVLVRGTPGAIEVEIQTSGGAIAPNTQAITGPDRIVVDFPGALPAAELRALQVNRGPLKAIRAGLFFSNPPITRVVLELVAPRHYRISTLSNAVVVKLASTEADAASNDVSKSHSTSLNAGTIDSGRSSQPRQARVDASAVTSGTVSAPKLQSAVLAAHGNTAPGFSRVPRLATARSADPTAMARVQPQAQALSSAINEPRNPAVVVIFQNGLLQIHADKATMAEVLFEVHRQTQAEIAIPSGAEQEKVSADFGPAPSRDVLAGLLNGSSYNFIFVGTEEKLERVVLTRRDSSPF